MGESVALPCSRCNYGIPFAKRIGGVGMIGGRAAAGTIIQIPPKQTSIASAVRH